MKLKLELIDSVKVLKVSGNVEPQHVSILKAGLQKIFKTKSANIVMDLTLVEKAAKETLKAIVDLKDLADDADAEYVIVSPREDIADSDNIDEAIQFVLSPKAKLQSKERRLKKKYIKLQERKMQLEDKLDALSARGQRLRILRKQNSDYRRLILSMENQVRHLKKLRLDSPAVSKSLDERIEYLDQTLTVILEQEGLLPVEGE